MAILGELPLTEGTINVKGKIAYSSQQPWIYNGSLRNNIIFGNDFDESRYDEVIKVCALERVSPVFYSIGCKQIGRCFDDNGYGSGGKVVIVVMVVVVVVLAVDVDGSVVVHDSDSGGKGVMVVMVVVMVVLAVDEDGSVLVGDDGNRGSKGVMTGGGDSSVVVQLLFLLLMMVVVDVGGRMVVGWC